MERIAQKFKNFQEAENWEIDYYLNMSVDERLHIARELQKRVYGDQTPGIREVMRKGQ